jgi:hypothetical protein
VGRRGQLLQAQGQVCLLYDLQDHADIELLPTDYARQCGCREAEVRPSHPTFLLRPDLDVLYFVCSAVFPKGEHTRRAAFIKLIGGAAPVHSRRERSRPTSNIAVDGCVHLKMQRTLRRRQRWRLTP